MNLNNIRPKNETEDSLLSTTKNCETLIEQNQTKHQEPLDFKMTKPKETIQFNPPTQVKEKWMLELTDFEVYNSIFNMNTTSDKFKLYNFPDEKLVVFLFKMSEMRLKKTWVLQILQLLIYKMKY